MRIWWLVAALYFVTAGVSLAHGQLLLALSLVCASGSALLAADRERDQP